MSYRIATRRFVPDKPSQICVCGGIKEDQTKRYCRRCGAQHGLRMHASHVGRGCGRRRKALNPAGE